MTLVTLAYTHAIYTCHMSRHVYTCKWPWAAFSTLIGHIWAHVEPICINVSHVTMFVWRDQLCLSFFASKWLTLFVRIANEENKRQDSHRHNSSLQASSGCFKVFNPAIKPQIVTNQLPFYGFSPENAVPRRMRHAGTWPCQLRLLGVWEQGRPGTII